MPRKCGFVTSDNQVIANRRTTEKELLKLNDEIAHYAIYAEYQSFLSQKAAKQIAGEKLQQLIQAKQVLINEQQSLDAQRKNLQIAVEQINKSLSYIFYSDSRLKLHLESDQMYHLTVNGKDVLPDKISCGERNASQKLQKKLNCKNCIVMKCLSSLMTLLQALILKIALEFCLS